MKKLKFILLLLVIITFSSCISDDTEIRNRLIIEGIGIDFDTRTDEYIITVQALSTAAAGNGQSEGTSTPVTNFTVRGRSVASAPGSLCENNDKFAIDRMLPKVDMGDLLFIHASSSNGCRYFLM